MPESICLHIQDRESGPIRVVEIPWISVRIGCAAYCEVRLNDPELSKEACRLQRRGRTWHLVPLGPKGSVLIQDQPIEGPCPLPFDVPFRVGSVCFTLRQNRSSEPDWEMYRTLPSAQPRMPVSSTLLSSFPPAAERDIAPPAAPPSQPAVAREFSIPSPPRINPPHERPASIRPANPWEARWKAVGARLQADRKQPLPPGQPHVSPPLDHYQSVPLKEPSVPVFTKAEPVVSPSRSRQFPTHSLTPAATPGYPAPPVMSTRVKPAASPLIKEHRATRGASDGTFAGLEQTAAPDRLSGSLVQTIEPIREPGVAQLIEAEKPIIEDRSLDDHSAWFEYYFEPLTKKTTWEDEAPAEPQLRQARQEPPEQQLRQARQEPRPPENSSGSGSVSEDSNRHEPASGVQVMEVAANPMTEKSQRPRHPFLSTHIVLSRKRSPDAGWIAQPDQPFVADTVMD